MAVKNGERGSVSYFSQSVKQTITVTFTGSKEDLSLLTL